MKIRYVNCNLRNEIESNLCHHEHFLSSNKNKTPKNSGLYGIQTHDLCDTSAVLHQLS